MSDRDSEYSDGLGLYSAKTEGAQIIYRCHAQVKPRVNKQRLPACKAKYMVVTDARYYPHVEYFLTKEEAIAYAAAKAVLLQSYEGASEVTVSVCEILSATPVLDS